MIEEVGALLHLILATRPKRNYLVFLDRFTKGQVQMCATAWGSTSAPNFHSRSISGYKPMWTLSLHTPWLHVQLAYTATYISWSIHLLLVAEIEKMNLPTGPLFLFWDPLILWHHCHFQSRMKLETLNLYIEYLCKYVYSRLTRTHT